MTLLKIIVCILLGLACILLALMLFILLSRVRLLALAKENKLEVRAGIGPLRFRLYPIPKAFKGRKAKEKAGKAKKQTAEAPPQAAFTFENIDKAELLEMALELLSQFRKQMYIETFRIEIIIATGDAAKTGILLGSAAAVTSILAAFFEQTYHVEDYQIAIDGDFDGDKTRWGGKIVFALRPISLLWILIKNFKRLRKMYQNLKVKKEEIAHE